LGIIWYKLTCLSLCLLPSERFQKLWLTVTGSFIGTPSNATIQFVSHLFCQYQTAVHYIYFRLPNLDIFRIAYKIEMVIQYQPHLVFGTKRQRKVFCWKNVEPGLWISEMTKKLINHAFLLLLGLCWPLGHACE